jgi:hypothetical protein
MDLKPTFIKIDDDYYNINAIAYIGKCSDTECVFKFIGDEKVRKCIDIKHCYEMKKLLEKNSIIIELNKS